MNTLQQYRDLIIVLTHKEIKLRYKNTLFGYLWSIANPLTFSLVFFLAFKIVMKINMEDYPLFLIAGLFPWQWFSNSLNASSDLFLTNASIIKKVNFARNAIPLATVLQDMIHFLLSIPVLAVFLFGYRKAPSLVWVWGIPFLLLAQLILVYGLSLLIASINLFFRDLQKLVAILVTLTFYCTPIIYPETMIPGQYQYLIHLNPVAPLLIGWRDLFLHGKIEGSRLLVSFFFAFFSLAAGYAVYRKLSWKFAEVL